MASKIFVVTALLASAASLTACEAFEHVINPHGDPKLASEAAVPFERAQSIALAAHSGKITEWELEKEAGGSGLRYSFDIDSGGTIYEVGVDAKDGAILENGIEAEGEADEDDKPARSTSQNDPAYRVASKIALPDGGWDLASFDPNLRRVYVTRTDAVNGIDADTNKVTASLAPANRGHATIPLKGGMEFLVTDGGADTATIFDAKTGAQLAAIKTGGNPDAALFDAASGLAVVMNARGGSITLIDPKTRASVGDLDLGGALELAASDGSGRIYVNVEDRNDLVVVDLKARKVVTRIPLTGCDGPTGIAYLPISGRILSSCANGVAAITNPKTLKAESTLPIGAGPDTVMYDAKRKLAFVPAGRAGELDIFADEAKGVRAAGKVATQVGARTGALDEKTGRIYLPAADYTPPAQAGGRPQIKPGTVVLVVVEPRA